MTQYDSTSYAFIVKIFISERFCWFWFPYSTSLLWSDIWFNKYSTNGYSDTRLCLRRQGIHWRSYPWILQFLVCHNLEIPDIGFDAGYGAYVGFHIVRKTHTHPVMLSFIALLLELKNNNVKEESKKSDAFIRARVSSTDWNLFEAEKWFS